MGETPIATKHYCYQCRHVVTVYVEIKCPFCQGGFIQACEGVASLYLVLSSDSEHSEADSDGEGIIGIYGSNPSDSVAVGIGSQNENNDFDLPRHGTRATWSKWILLLTNLALEILSAGFDQVSSPYKPQYALIGLLLAITGMIVYILELIHSGIEERVVLRRRGILWCFYHPPPNNMLFGTFHDVIGLVLAVAQCLCSAIQYHFHRRHAINPIKISLVGVLFFLGLVVVKLSKTRRYTVDETL